jgi:hypothetical protein
MTPRCCSAVSLALCLFARPILRAFYRVPHPLRFLQRVGSYNLPLSARTVRRVSTRIYQAMPQ